uniref:Beta-galactosidase n=1 Tax=Ursus maritimus TaxID=29073 RepID=A0A452TIW9_URSMA
ALPWVARTQPGPLQSASPSQKLCSPGTVLGCSGYAYLRLTELLIQEGRSTLGLNVEGSSFTLDGSPFLIIAGTIHYFRVPREYWRDRLMKLKACGFNTVTTHIPWNLHEPRKGWFYFTANLDFMAFIAMASDVGLWVILCPGPYIGSDLDLGGLPSWLLRDPKMKLRTTYRGFTKAVNLYFDKIIPKIVQLQYGKGGPIIALQVENEYGSYHQDKRYMPYIKKVSAPLIFLHIDIFIFSVFTKCSRNTELDIYLPKTKMHKQMFNACSLNIPQRAITFLKLLFFPHFSFSSYLCAVLMRDVREMFNMSFSLNFYMFHGGTNFGFMGGSASLDHYLPMVTSYDYGALLKENGEHTTEYLTYQEFFSSSLAWFLFLSLPQPISSVKPICMENLSVNQGNGQSSGYILYETVITNSGLLTTRGHLQDRGQVRDSGWVPVYNVYPTLRILVENQGRLAYGKDINKERKGLIGDIYLNNSPLREFKIYSLDMKTKFLKRDLPNIWKPALFKHQGPAFFLGILRMGNDPRDTFIKMEGWTKGVIFINGQNLGRYWNVGPQETLYLPGPWLHPGSNEIIVFEEFKSGVGSLGNQYFLNKRRR